MTTVQRILCVAAILSVWAFFAWTGRTPIDGFITSLQGTLVALGVFHITSNGGQQQ